MMLKVFLFALMLTACTTPEAPPVKYGFPASFKALQTVRITRAGSTNTLIANLTKIRTSHYEVIFLHPLTQLPLLRIRSLDGQVRVERLYDKLPDDIPSDRIIESIRKLYDSPAFTREGQDLYFEDGTLNYHLGDFKAYAQTSGACKFPETVVIRFSGGKEDTTLTVKTTDIECQ